MTTTALLEHVNFTVSDPHRTAQILNTLFGWEIRWEGPSKNNGQTIHIGTKDQYIALYTNDKSKLDAADPDLRISGLNHIGVVVDDLTRIEQKVIHSGFLPHNHGDYEPGKRFYFHDHDNIEFEVISYTDQ